MGAEGRKYDVQAEIRFRLISAPLNYSEASARGRCVAEPQRIASINGNDNPAKELDAQAALNRLTISAKSMKKENEPLREVRGGRSRAAEV
jgi:hypothetical protein